MSFRHEKYIPEGGPDGGDGGRGGNVIILADSDDISLTMFRERRSFRAGAGRAGEGGRRSGRDGDDLVLHVPPGTVIREDTTVLADLDRRGAEMVVAQGGGGGRGNARFATATRQAPRVSELGEHGERRRVHLELKLIADIGLVGLPNAGKSTLLAALTGAHPRIGDYPFTTLHPNLGVAETTFGRTLLIADVPGLIAGAHRGAGLGIGFLRHLERTRVLVHVVDAAAGVAAARDAIRVIDDELRSFSAVLAERPRIVAFNKVDVAEGAATADALIGAHPDAFRISAATGDGCAALLAAAALLVERAASASTTTTTVVDATHRRYTHRVRGAPSVARDGDVFRVSGATVERMVDATDLDSEEAVARLQRRMRRAGVDDALRAAGAKDGDTVRIGDSEFTFSEEGG